jgi:hypothetical protein
MVLKTCSSNVSSLASAFDLNTGLFVLQSASERTQMTLAYPSEGMVDGRTLSGFDQNLYVVVGRIPYPLPSADVLEAYKLNGKNLTISNIPEEQQTFMLPVVLAVPLFQHILFYDPDVSITLLFNPEDQPPNVATAPLDTVSSDVKVGVVVGAVVGSVAAAALVVLFFATIVFPYMRRRKESAKELQELEDPIASSVDQRASSVWKQSTKPQTDT